ncbi:MAG: M14 family metallopeptidase [Thermoplasmata archaeon]|jgi:predicted deacylase|nr:M14 family metallopeptidase [Thermoplasmata archaeon]
MNSRLLIVVFSLLLLVSLVLCPSCDVPSLGDPPEPEAMEVTAGGPTTYAYKNYGQIMAELASIASAHSDIVELHDIGDSWEKTQGIADRDIIAVKISDNVAVDEDEPEVMIVGLHHAREWSTSELVLEVVKNLTTAYGNDTRLSWLVDNRELWIVPVVNPDGLDFALADDDMWRKNRRLNWDGSYGVDLNRNYNGSQNGDSAGEWGGVGTSHIPTYDTYCGEAPFSEPETQAIRDMVLARDFQIALDFHSYGEDVMWPWSYTTNLTADNEDFVRLGTALAAINGYAPAQSVDMYATTGDSLDWLYGGADVYPILFEVGREFHPEWASDVEEIIQDNLPAALYGIEAAGDREARVFDIAHSVEAVRGFSYSGFDVNATIAADRGVDTSALTVFYRVDGKAWASVPMSKSVGNDTYTGTVPAQSVGSIVEYYIVAQDEGGIELMSPMYAPYEVHSFLVTAEGASDIEIIWDPPTLIDGSDSVTFSLEARNLSLGADLVFYMLNGTFYYTTIAEPITGSPEFYSIEIVAGLPLGLYDVWLTSEVGGVVEYESLHDTTELQDWTLPAIGSHEAVQLSADSLQVTVPCTDLYGVVSVTLVSRVSTDYVYTEMVLTEGTSKDGTWSATIAISGYDSVEYMFVAYQADLQHSELPIADWFVFTPIPEFGPVMVALGAAAAVLFLVAFSRARRA